MEAYILNTKNLENKESRLNIRASQYQKEIITEAARKQHTSISNFILGIAYREAQEILADETDFKLPAERWEAFCAALDKKPNNILALQKLLSNSSVFDK